MLTVQNNVVIFGGHKSEEVLNDTRCVVSAFIKVSKEAGMSDELIEKTCVTMIAEGFEMLSKNQMFDMKNGKNN